MVRVQFYSNHQCSHWKDRSEAWRYKLLWMNVRIGACTFSHAYDWCKNPVEFVSNLCFTMLLWAQCKAMYPSYYYNNLGPDSIMVEKDKHKFHVSHRMTTKLWDRWERQQKPLWEPCKKQPWGWSRPFMLSYYGYLERLGLKPQGKDWEKWCFNQNKIYLSI